MQQTCDKICDLFIRSNTSISSEQANCCEIVCISAAYMPAVNDTRNNEYRSLFNSRSYLDTFRKGALYLDSVYQARAALVS